MPAPYSLDLRKRVVAACEKGEESQDQIARRFDIGLRTVKGWLHLKRTTGDVIPKEHEHRGQLPIIDNKGLLFIKGHIEKKPDILISEIRELYAKKFKVKVAQSMVSRALKTLNLRRKKKSTYALEQERNDIKKNGNNGKRK